jgi:hypothetical protein
MLAFVSWSILYGASFTLLCVLVQLVRKRDPKAAVYFALLGGATVAFILQYRQLLPGVLSILGIVGIIGGSVVGLLIAYGIIELIALLRGGPRS